MRYTFAAAALVSLTVGAIAGGHDHAFAHRRLHARDAEAVADPEPTEYSWTNGQCFGTWGCLSTTGAPASSSVPPAQNVPANPSPAPKEGANKAQVGAIVNSPASSPTATATASSGGNSGSSDILSAICKAGMQEPQNDGTISSSKTGSCSNEVTVKNNCGKPMLWVCWGSAGSWVNAKPPVIAQSIAQGASSTFYVADAGQYEQGGACAPVFADTSLVNGQIKETWVEMTFTQTAGWSVVDVSKEVTMSGTPISLTTGQCTSSMSQCVFECTNGADTCGAANTYILKDSSNTPGCQGANTATGGCTVGGPVVITVG